MESEDSANEEDVSMKLFPNKGEAPDYKSAGDSDGTLSGREESEDLFKEWLHMKV